MADPRPAARLTVFLSEDDEVDGRAAADAVVEEARAAGLGPVSVRRAVEGFGSSGHLRTNRFADSMAGLPVLVEVTGTAEGLRSLSGRLAALLPGVLVTLEGIEPEPA
jgi:PII-like signaling protein